MPRSIDHILVAVDGSQGSRHAAAFAGRLAEALEARVTLLHVFHPTSSAEAMGLASLTREGVAQKLHEEAAAYFRGAHQAMALDGSSEVRVDERVELGDPAGSIVRIAGELVVDLVVLGSRGRTPLADLLLGSVSEIVVRRASCPVTVVR